MADTKIFKMAFAKIYSLYIQKAEKHNRSQEDVDRIIGWLTGYDKSGLEYQIQQGEDLETFFAQAPAMHLNCYLIKGLVCGVRVEDVRDPLLQKIRFMDKLIDELARGKSIEKILRT